MSTLVIPTAPNDKARFYSEILNNHAKVEIIYGKSLVTVVFHWSDKWGKARAAIFGIDCKVAEGLLKKTQKIYQPGYIPRSRRFQRFGWLHIPKTSGFTKERLTMDQIYNPKEDALKENVIKVERETRFGPDPLIDDLKKLGRKSNPGNKNYCGSLAIHFFVDELGANAFAMQQSTKISGIPPKTLHRLIKEYVAKIMKIFDQLPPAKRFVDWSDNSTGKNIKG